jgi:hypothetical protein
MLVDCDAYSNGATSVPLKSAGRLLKTFSFVAMAGLATALSASADVLNFGALTRDTITGLDWLDLSATQNRSFIDVSSQFAPGGEFFGYRYATVAEVRTFWVDAGLLSGVPQMHRYFRLLC